MRYLEAPDYMPLLEQKTVPQTKLFLAGGITGCPDWQKKVVKALSNEQVTIFNPRRNNFDVKDKNASKVQIKWERDHLNIANIIMFWFCKNTIQPIVLLEFGKYGFRNNVSVVIGVEPGYPREEDVRIQYALEHPDVKIYDSLDDVISHVKELL